MLKFKYIINAGAFVSIKEFQAYLNRMGAKGYELVSYRQVDKLYLLSKHNIGTAYDELYFEVCWKIEDHDS